MIENYKTGTEIVIGNGNGQHTSVGVLNSIFKVNYKEYLRINVLKAISFDSPLFVRWTAIIKVSHHGLWNSRPNRRLPVKRTV